VRVADVMAEDCVTVDSDANVQDVVDDVLLRTGRRCVLVSNDGLVVGMITPHEVRAVDRDRWGITTAGDAMRPLQTIHTVGPATPVADALTTMARDDVNQLPVVVDGRLRGIVSRGHILRLLQSHAELSKAS